MLANRYLCIMIKEDQEIRNPIENGNLSSYANRLGERYSSTDSVGSQKEKGQFFTPIEIANFMGKQIVTNRTSISILDLGSGIGILSCSLIENITKQNFIRNIKLVVYEIDTAVLKYTKQALEYLKQYLNQKGIELSYVINSKDFVLSNYQALDLQPQVNGG